MIVVEGTAASVTGVSVSHLPAPQRPLALVHEPELAPHSQSLLAQSESSVQALLKTQALQDPPPQSTSVSLPSLMALLQPIEAQMLLEQVLLAVQSELIVHILSGSQRGHAEEPPQSTSLSLASFWPLAH